MNPSWKVAINDVKPQGMRSAADTPLLVLDRVRVATQNRRKVRDIDFLVVEILAVDILLGTAFNDANIKLISLGKQIVYLFSSISVAVKGFDHEDSPVAQVDAITEHSVCCRIERMMRIQAVSQVLVQIRALQQDFKLSRRIRI